MSSMGGGRKAIPHHNLLHGEINRKMPPLGKKMLLNGKKGPPAGACPGGAQGAWPPLEIEKQKKKKKKGHQSKY